MKSKKMMALVTAAAMAFGLAGCGGEIPQLQQQHLLRRQKKKLPQQKLLQKQQRLQSQKAVITGK